jgi:hypothetical protein
LWLVALIFALIIVRLQALSTPPDGQQPVPLRHGPTAHLTR